MTECRSASGRLALLATLAGAAMILAGCDDPGQSAPDTGATARAKPAPTVTAPSPVSADATRAMWQPTAPAQSGQALPNDPSAPSNTPLCGMAAQETNGISRQLLSRQYAEAGQCSAYACYDAATATYIGADGFRHVCR